jgi:hypothetical protein
LQEYGISRSFLLLYSPECVEGEFSDVHFHDPA